MLDWNTVQVLGLKRHQCRSYHVLATTSRTRSWSTPDSTVTKDSEQLMLQELVNSTREDVRSQQAIGPDAPNGTMDRRIAPEVNWSGIDAIGGMRIDEVPAKKGHRDFVVVIGVDVSLWLSVIAPLNKQSEAVARAFCPLISRRLRRIIDVVYFNFDRDFIGSAKTVFVKRVLKRHRRTLSKAPIEGLKNGHLLLRHRRADMNADACRPLNPLFVHSMKPKEGYESCVALTTGVESCLSKRQNKGKLCSWMRRVTYPRFTGINRDLVKPKTRFKEITKYLVCCQSRGFIEGLNNMPKVIKRRRYGMTSLKQLYQAVFISLNGYS